MVKLGCFTFFSMVETNSVGRVNLFLLVLGWAVMFIHHYMYFDNSSYKPLVQYDLFTGETLSNFCLIFILVFLFRIW